MSWKPQSDCPCASGTWHTSGAAIEAAIKAQHRNAILSAPRQIRLSRSPQEWKRLYAEAMKEKRKTNGMVLV